MSQNLGNELFKQMQEAGYIDQNNQFKSGMLFNEEGKRLFIKQVSPKKSPINTADVFFQYSHVVSVGGKLKSDPGVVLGFDLKNQTIHPLLYRNDLLDHSIHVYEKGEFNEGSAVWLLEYWATWFDEIKANHYVPEVHLKTA